MSAPPSQPQPALPPGAERLAILALASGAFVMALNANVMAPLKPYLELEFAPAARAFWGISDEKLGILIGAAGLAGAVGAFLLGPLVDKLGRRMPMFVGMLVFSVASFGHVAAESYESLILVRALSGFAAGVVYSSASAAVADLVPYERRGRAMGIFAAGMFLGLPVGLPIAGLMAEHALFSEQAQWRSIYWLQGGIGVLAMVAIRIYLPRDLGKGHAFFQNLPRLFRIEVFAVLASVMLYVGAFYTAVQFVGGWLDETSLLPKQHQWSVWLILGLCSAAGSLFLGRMADRFGKWRWTNFATIAVALLLVALTLVTGIFGLLIVGIPLAIVSASRTGPLQALISELVPSDTRGTLMGVRSAVVNLGTGVFPVIAVVFTTSYEETLYFSAGGVFVAFLLVLILVKKR